MDFLASIARRLASKNVCALLNTEVAKSLANLLKSYLGESFSKIDFHYDALASGLRGMSDGDISFPARPVEFENEDLNGTILVRGKLNPPIQGSGQAIAHRNTQLTLEVGFYFKTPRLPGQGKYMMARPAGVLDIEFDDSGTPVIKNDEEVSSLISAYSSLTDQVTSEIPEGAKRQTPKDPHERKIRNEQNEEAERYTREKEREKRQQQELQEKQDADASTHGSFDAFVQYMQDNEQTSFGPGDLQKILDTMYKTKNERMMWRNVVIDELKKRGLKWDSNKRTVASSPDDISASLREIVRYIETSSTVSRQLVATRLSDLLKLI